MYVVHFKTLLNLINIIILITIKMDYEILFENVYWVHNALNTYVCSRSI